MRVFRQMVREFWLPLLVGLLWTWQRVQWSKPDWPAVAIAHFTAAFFFTSWGIGHVMRIKRQQTVEDSFKSVEGRLIELRERMTSLSAVSTELQVQTKDIPDLQRSAQDISTIAAAVDTELAAANSAMSNALSSYAEAIEEPNLLARFVWRSTPSSVAAGYVSALAILEVILAVSFYWVIVLAVGTPSFYLVIGLFAVPFLLLRSEESVALGVRWAERYVDDGLADVFAKPLNMSPLRVLLSVALALLGGGISAYLIGSFLGLQSGGLVSAAKIILTAYLAFEIAAGIAIAIAPRYPATIGGNRRLMLAAIIAGAATIAAGATLSGAALSLAPIAAAVVGVLGLGTLLEAPRTVEFLRARIAQGEKLDSVQVVEASFDIAPNSYLSFALGIFLGGWLRTMAIRFAATAMHLRAGIRALPDNWWRTLFVMDVFHPPELVPGYRRDDFFNLPRLVERLRESTSLSEKFFSAVGTAILYVPAYAYRLMIKSTCWVYMPIVYMVRQPTLLTLPQLLYVLWRDPREWWRRFLMVLTLAAFFVYNMGITKIPISGSVAEAFEYIFVIESGVPKSWQVFGLTSAFITLVLLMYAGRLKMSAAGDVDLNSSAVQYLMRVRNISTTVLIIIVLAHAAAWLTPLQNYLPDAILKALRRV